MCKHTLTCGHCEKYWCEALNPSPGALCPFCCGAGAVELPSADAPCPVANYSALLKNINECVTREALRSHEESIADYYASGYLDAWELQALDVRIMERLADVPGIPVIGDFGVSG